MSLLGSFWKKDSGNSRKASSVGKWQVGDKIGNHFEIYQILGGEDKSGMGIVYICYDHTDGDIVALKTIQDRYQFSEEHRKLFAREALTWVEIGGHPYIVYADFATMQDERVFIHLEYISPNDQGRNTLNHCLGSLSFPDILKFSIQFCYGMEYAYSRGIDAHRDIKPDNIMIAADRTVKITDFGLAKAFQELQLKEDIISSGENPGLSIFQTKGGRKACGTLPYMAPEQFDGYADRRSDIYAFGITLYEMVAGGKLPFIGKGRTQQEAQEEYEKLHKYEKVPVISSPLFFLIQKCLEKDPDRRYQDFVLIQKELQEFLLKETGDRITPPKAGKKRNEIGELICKALTLKNLGKFQEAVSILDKALRLKPDDTLAWEIKGQAYFLNRRNQEAIFCLDKVIEKNPTSSAWFLKGNALFHLDRYEEANLCFDKTIEMNPRNSSAWIGKGSILFVFNRYEEALSCVSKAIEIYPNSSRAHQLKQLILEKLGR